jgi:hypothetical protein
MRVYWLMRDKWFKLLSCSIDLLDLHLLSHLDELHLSRQLQAYVNHLL